MKGITACDEGGFKKLQYKLLNGEKTGCVACQDLLCHTGFCHQELEKEVLAFLGQPDLPKAESPAAIAESATPADDSEKAEKGENQQDAEDGNAKDDENAESFDPFAVVRQHEPIITLLEPGQYGKAYPFRCNICKSKTQPEGKIGNLCVAKAKSIKHFLNQHLESMTHKRNLRQHLERQDGINAKSRETWVDCDALRIKDPHCAGILSACQKEFGLWASLSNLSTFAKHQYWYDASQDSWCIRSAHCMKRCPVSTKIARHVCEKCLQLGHQHSVFRSVHRFALKFYSSRLLSARLFLGRQEADRVETELLASFLGERDAKRVQQILKLSNAKLQQFVRAAVLSDGRKSHGMEIFHQTVVSPCLQCNVTAVPEALSESITKFTAMLASERATGVDAAKLRVALGCIKGSYDNHPMLLGLALQCHRMAGKQERGIYTMVGRRSTETERERELIADTGMQLAILNGNADLCREFGMSTAKLNFLKKLDELSLPQPALALLDKDNLSNNFLLLDQRFERTADRSKCALFAHLVPSIL